MFDNLSTVAELLSLRKVLGFTCLTPLERGVYSHADRLYLTGPFRFPPTHVHSGFPGSKLTAVPKKQETVCTTRCTIQTAPSFVS